MRFGRAARLLHLSTTGKDIIFEGHDLTSCKEILLDEGEDPVLKPFVLVTYDNGLVLVAAPLQLIGPIELSDPLLHHGRMVILINR